MNHSDTSPSYENRSMFKVIIEIANDLLMNFFINRFIMPYLKSIVKLYSGV